MNIPMRILVALLAIIPLSGSAQTGNCSEQTGSCTVNGVPVPSDPVLIEGTGGDDIIDCSSSPERHDIYGYNGYDLLIGSDCDDFIAGGGNGDSIQGRGGDDAIDGGAGNDVIYGEDGNDIIFGGVGSAPASGVGCELEQTAFIALGSSYLTKGGSGDDIIFGGDGNDCIDAGSGEDIVFGGNGDDTLEGGNHGDMLYGGPGDDHIDGGWHTDTCVGGGYEEDDGDEFVDSYRNCESVDNSSHCGDGTCNIGEDSCSCPGDCGPPPATPALEPEWCADGEDNDCDGQTDCADADCAGNPILCPGPPPPPPAACENNGICNAGENCSSCPQDCAGIQKGKPSNRYCCGDGTPDGAEGDGSICNGNY